MVKYVIFSFCTLTLWVALQFAPMMAYSQGTLLLRQPTISDNHVAFVYGADLWICDRNGGDARRLTSTAAVESSPYFSPDGQQIAFSSNRSGQTEVYTVGINGGTPKRLTYHPAPSEVRGWTLDGENILYATSRETAPTGFYRLWTVPATGGPSTLLPIPKGNRGDYGPDGLMVIEPTKRWDVEWRAYRGGQNTPLIIMNMNDLSEHIIPGEFTTDIYPVWVGSDVYFLSDRDWTSNIWKYSPGDGGADGELSQVTEYEGSDIKYLYGHGETLIFEREGRLHLMDVSSGEVTPLDINVSGDFPWAEPRLENVTKMAKHAKLSPTGKRVILEARGEIFTIPVKDGSIRNLTNSSGAADRMPLWSPDGSQIAWFSDQNGEGYEVVISSQDGFEQIKTIDIGESKFAWEPTWSPDGKYIAFADNKVRISVIDVETGKVGTVDTAGHNMERGRMGLTWSPDSKWLAYSKSGDNFLRRIYAYSIEKGQARPLTNELADAYSPAWDEGGKYLYFTASTDLALASGWANTSSMQADPSQGLYMLLLNDDVDHPFPLKSDDEPTKDEASEDKEDDEDKKEKDKSVVISFDNTERRTIALPLPVKKYAALEAGPEGHLFFIESSESAGSTLKKFSVSSKKAEDFMSNVQYYTLSHDRKKLLAKSGPNFRVVDTGSPPSGSDGQVKMELRMMLDREEEWAQIYREALRYEQDYFYDPGLHGRDWDEVRERYAPLLPYIKHRSDLTYVLDQINGELSVGHSFVFGGDFPATDTSKIGQLGADFDITDGFWRIKRIYTSESWNPGLKAPLAEPGLEIEEGDYILGINGQFFDGSVSIFMYLDGLADQQITLHVGSTTDKMEARQITAVPISNEYSLRQRAWVEDNRRLVDSLSDGRLAYVWVPNTSKPGFVSFNRYFFAQQDKLGAVIDERYNGGGLLDDYMVDLMTRQLRAAITNEVPGGRPFQLPAGILGPKVLLINEYAGSGGDFFPWVFRQQGAGPLIGSRTWGGLVKSSVHYPFIDGGAMTAPDNAVFDPINNEWIGENIGIAPDIDIRQDAQAMAEGRDVQIEKAVKETLKLLDKNQPREITPPPFPQPAIRPKH